MTEVHKTTRAAPVLTPTDKPWRLAFPHLHTQRTKRPNGQPMEKPRWDATLLAPKLHPDPALCPNYALLKELCMDAARQAWGPEWPQGGHWPIQDGDSPPRPKAPVPGQPAAPVDPNKYPWRKGNWVIEVGSGLDTGPKVCILQNGVPTEIPSQTFSGRQLYKSGDYVVVEISAYTFNKNGKFGCNFTFNGVCFVGEGEAIGSGPRTAQAMFGSVATFAAPMAAPGVQPMPGRAPMPQPQAYAQPAAVAPQPQYAQPGPAPVAQPQAYAAPVAPGPAPVYAQPAPQPQAFAPPALPPSAPGLAPFPTPVR